MAWVRPVCPQVGAGELVAVVGKVGGGKSSLLNALLGEMRFRGGSINLAGTTAYTSQVGHAPLVLQVPGRIV